jgi:hypothetical protein
MEYVQRLCYNRQELAALREHMSSSPCYVRFLFLVLSILGLTFKRLFIAVYSMGTTNQKKATWSVYCLHISHSISHFKAYISIFGMMIDH